MALYSESAASGPSKLTPEQQRIMNASDIEEYESDALLPPLDETSPLLSSGASTTSTTAGSSDSGKDESLLRRMKRPSPLWMAALTVCASIARSMVIAPRVEVYTQLACHNLVPIHHTDQRPVLQSFAPSSAIAARDSLVSVHFSAVSGNGTSATDDDDDEPITTIPSIECRKNRVVQAAASRIQYLMTVIMGLLSAVTTGYWGQFGDRFGRRPVMIISSFGLMFVDIVFVLVSRPHSVFSGHGHKLLLVAPFVEGLLGGWSTFIAATNAYISDCTEHGSRAKIFSRISGITYIGFAVGPMLGNLWVELHPSKTTDAVFHLSIILALVILALLVLLVPESVNQETRQRRQQEAREEDAKSAAGGAFSTLRKSVGAFFAPLSLFAPKNRGGEVAWSDYRDWNMTCLAIALFCYLLTIALFQLKYLYAGIVYSWGATELGYYISIMGWVRAAHLLFVLPAVIRMFRRRSRRNITLKQRSVTEAHAQDVSDMEAAASSREIHFDLLVVKLSLGFDLVSHLLVTLLHPASGSIFTLVTVPASMAAGMLPGVQSLALCILRASGEAAEIGKLFGAISVLQAVGSTILGPTIFVFVFQRTVGRWNEAIFVLAAGLIFVALCMVSMIRSRKYVIEGTLASVRAHRSHWLREEDDPADTVTSPTSSAGPSRLLSVPVPAQAAAAGKRRRERERGRSRRSKDLSVTGASPSVSDSDPGKSLPHAFHKYKLPLQHQDSAAV